MKKPVVNVFFGILVEICYASLILLGGFLMSALCWLIFR